jgi:hypothetical protein
VSSQATQNGAPRIMTEFLNKPHRFELRDEYTKGPNPRPLPTIKASYYRGKPATQKVLEHFCRSTPVVSSCDNPRCLLRLVTVPKRDPGAPKASEPTPYRVTMNAHVSSRQQARCRLLPMRSRSSITGTSISRWMQQMLSGPFLLMTSLIE